jgi:flavodoxin
MKILITYYTMTGNTKKIAQAIFSESKKSGTAKIKKIDKVNPGEINDCRVVFVGSPCHAGDLPIQVKEFLSGLPESSPFYLAGFITHSSPVYKIEDYEKCLLTFRDISKKKKIKFLDFFECQGFLTPELHDMVKKMHNASDEKWKEMVLNMKGHPNAEDEKKARKFTARVLQSVKIV